jgi:hypothetical protein
MLVMMELGMPPSVDAPKEHTHKWKHCQQHQQLIAAKMERHLVLL